MLRTLRIENAVSARDRMWHRKLVAGWENGRIALGNTQNQKNETQ